jgi:hypothetical protein
MKTLATITLFILTSAIFPKLGYNEDLTVAEKAGLQLMREEEKLAQDVYTVLYEKWQLRPFSNIARSETRHFEAVGYLLETYNLEDPAYPEPGKFKNPELAALYDSLVARGSESLVAALEVGAFIEEVDIKDLNELLALNPDSTISVVYENLLRGSGNHLRAFTGQLASRNIVYKATVLEPDIYAAIVSSEHQQGNGKACIEKQPNCNKQQNKGGKQFRNRGKGKQGRGNCSFN